jgi:cell division septum initiation protein DivIVA
MTDNRAQAIKDLRDRIARLRERIGQSTDIASVQSIQIPEEEKTISKNMDSAASTSRTSEADDFKARLLSKRK